RLGRPSSDFSLFFFGNFFLGGFGGGSANTVREFGPMRFTTHFPTQRYSSSRRSISSFEPCRVRFLILATGHLSFVHATIIHPQPGCCQILSSVLSVDANEIYIKLIAWMIASTGRPRNPSPSQAKNITSHRARPA